MPRWAMVVHRRLGLALRLLLRRFRAAVVVTRLRSGIMSRRLSRIVLRRLRRTMLRFGTLGRTTIEIIATVLFDQVVAVLNRRIALAVLLPAFAVELAFVIVLTDVVANERIAHAVKQVLQKAGISRLRGGKAGEREAESAGGKNDGTAGNHVRTPYWCYDVKYDATLQRHEHGSGYPKVQVFRMFGLFLVSDH